jgi:hypothetical protein
MRKESTPARALQTGICDTKDEWASRGTGWMSLPLHCGIWLDIAFNRSSDRRVVMSPRLCEPSTPSSSPSQFCTAAFGHVNEQEHTNACTVSMHHDSDPRQTRPRVRARSPRSAAASASVARGTAIGCVWYARTGETGLQQTRNIRSLNIEIDCMTLEDADVT